MNGKINYLKESSITIYNIIHDGPYDRKTIHRHNHFEILLFKTGKNGCQIIDFKEYEITSQSIFIITPGQAHQLKCLPEEKGLVIKFTKEFLELSVLPSQINWFFKLQTNPKIVLDTLQFDKLYIRVEKIKELYDDTTSTFKLQKLQKLFGLILFELLELIPDKIEFGRKENVSYEFMSLVVDNFKEIRLVNKYAKLLSTPINKLEKEVKKHFGRSPIHIINELLIIEIKRMLLIEKLTHKEIAFMLKFDSQSSYTRFVKTHTKMTPTDLKKDIQKNKFISFGN